MRTPQLRRPGGRSRSRRLAALLTATAVAASLLSAPAGPASAAPGPPATGANVSAGFLPTDAEPVAVTLITGDTVYWQDSGDGNPRVAEIEEAPRDYPVTFDQSGTQEDFYVIPTDVMEHVVAGTVDMELFNIPGLIRQGLDDAATSELPVIVTFDQDQSVPQLARDADALPATDDATAVAGIKGAGVRVDRAKAGTFRQAVFGAPDRHQTNRTAGAPGLDSGVDKVMLDQMLEIDLSESVPQIGAPQAWDAGFTGEGVTVAVLDTGVDASHPDLAGQVVATANFTDEPDATDNHGHGTHVASTIAGTGAASDGARTGVAPGADLLIGKVCFPNAAGDGVCPTSAIMAGMEWATEQDADIVNMSLGGGATDGTDPLSQLVNELSAETGALFVTSAGNFGFFDFVHRVVGAPAAADAALAVGAVDKSDQMARFSSRGPRVGDHAVKPEITAPGVGIVAARGAGTSLGNPVDDHYTSLDGTSMASPHVTGAAALLAQATGLAGVALKDALVSTAADGGHHWYAQGTGRVDIQAALDSPAYTQGTLNFGGVEGRAERNLIYTNRSEEDVILTLEAAATDFLGQPGGSVTLSANALTVPAHGTASVTVTVTLDGSNLNGQEAFGGVITAANPGGATLRTGVGFGPPLNRVDVEVLDSHGNRIGTPTAAEGRVHIINDTFEWGNGGRPSTTLRTIDGVATGRIPPGTYTFITNVLENSPDAGPLEFVRESVVAQVEIVIDSDITLTLDARNAVPVEVTVPRPADKRTHEVALIRQLPPGGPASDSTFVFGGWWPVYVTPAPPGELADLSLWVHWTLAEPQPLHPIPWSSSCPPVTYWCYSETPAYIYNLPILYDNGIPQNLNREVSRADLVEVPTRYHSERPDALIQHQFHVHPSLNGSVSSGQPVRMWIRPGRVTEYFLADDRTTWNRAASIQYRQDNAPPTFLFTQWSRDRFTAAEAGRRRTEERWFEAPVRVGAADLREEFLTNPNGLERYATASRGGPDGAQFVPGFYAMDNSRGHLVDSWGSSWKLASWRMWNLDTGTELESGPFDPIPGVVPAFQLAEHDATYRLAQTEHYPRQLVGDLFRTGPATTTWTFASRSLDAEVPRGYLCPVQQTPGQNLCQIQPLIQLEYDLGLDLDNAAPDGRAHLLTVTAGHHSKAISRAPVTELTVQASFDDGETWQEARVLGPPRRSFETGGALPSPEPYQQYRVLVRHPKLSDTSGSVTLRVRAEDANGGTVDQTIHRAYMLR